MPRKTLRKTATSTQAPARVWPELADFASPWHPLVDWMELEAVPGRAIRRFGVKGDRTLYREELSYLSHSDHCMSYRLLQGIEGLHSYQARVKISPSDSGGSLASWQAEIDATEARLDDICTGTGAIFEAGLSQLMTCDRNPRRLSGGRKGNARVQHCILAGTPRLAMTVAPEGLKSCPVLCLFLHGIGGNRENWRPQIEALGHDFAVAALDLRGYGDSSLGFEASTIDSYCDDIEQVMAHFGAKKVVLIGLSYGSWIATSFAMRHPEKLAGLVLSGGCTGMSEAGPDEREAFRLSREVPMEAGQTPADFAPGVVEVIAGPKASEQMRQSLAESMAAISVETYRDALNCFCNPLEKFDFGKISCPVLLMTGSHDALATPDEIRQISHRIHEAENRSADAGPVQFEVIRDAGHLCNLEQPAAYTAHLKSFLTMLDVALPTKGKQRKQAAQEAKRQRILDAALAQFAQNGYAGTSMQAIAAAAGVSKPTLYQYIGQKEDVFAAILEMGRQTLLTPFEQSQDAPLVPRLWAFARTYADFVLSPDMLALARVVIGEAERVPDLAHHYVEAGPDRVLRGIVRYVQSQIEQGRLIQVDAEIAAEHLWSLILSAPRTKALHFPAQPIAESEIERSVRSGLFAFLRAYSAQPETDLAELERLNWND